MLIRTKIKDFQSLHDVEIEHGGLTVLTGQSDLGKSAIIRAMRLLHRNDGTASYVRHGKSKLSVEQTFDNGNIVSIEKGKTLNTYHANGKALAKIGKEVPETIRELIQTDELILDKDLTCDLNFSGQFDAPFLLTESGTLVTKVVSALSGIEIIYSAIREGAAQAQKLKAVSQVLTGNIANLEKFDGLQEQSERLQSELVSLQTVEVSLQTASLAIEKLGLLLSRSEILRSKVIDVVPEESALEILIKEHKSLVQAEKTLIALESLQKRAKSLVSTEILDVEALVELQGKITTIYSFISADEKVYTNLVSKNQLVEAFNKKYDVTVRELSKLEKEEQEIKSTIQICDKCGRIL